MKEDTFAWSNISVVEFPENKDKGEEVIYSKDNDKFPELKRQVCAGWKGKLIPNKLKAKIEREIT